MLAFQPTDKLKDIPDQPIKSVYSVEVQQSNSTTLADETFVVKFYRKIDAGISPEIEMGRFLTETSPVSPTHRICWGVSN